MFAAITEAVLQHRHLVFDAAPLANQHRARFKSPHRREFKRSPGLRVSGDTLEQPARGCAKPTQRPLLDTVGDCPYEQIPAEPRRRLAPVKFAPARLQLLDPE